jgi:hypothetical protein
VADWAALPARHNGTATKTSRRYFMAFDFTPWRWLKQAIDDPPLSVRSLFRQLAS